MPHFRGLLGVRPVSFLMLLRLVREPLSFPDFGEFCWVVLAARAFGTRSVRLAVAGSVALATRAPRRCPGRHHSSGGRGPDLLAPPHLVARTWARDAALRSGSTTAAMCPVGKA